MLNSQRSENLSKIKKEKTLKIIDRTINSSELSEIIEQVAKDANISRKLIQISSQNEEIELFAEVEESDEENKNRISDLEISDLNAFSIVLSKYNSYLMDKDKIKELAEKHKYVIPIWQKSQYNLFMEQVSMGDVQKESYENGLKDGEKKYKELKEKLGKL